MEEQILKIIKESWNNYYDDGDTKYTIPEIVNHIMKFLTWFQMGLHPFGRIEHIDELLYVNFNEGSKEKYTLLDVYKYWLNNIN